MSRKALLTLPLLAGTVLAGPAGDPSLTTSEPDAFQWLTPSIDARLRYEFREVDGEDASHALTARARVGLLAGDFNGFSAFGELEATEALIEDYKSNPTASATTEPFVLGNTVISDPENVELNQAWVQYKGHGATIKAGRQRIKLNNDAFIGNVGWRQNEQTYDAISGSYTGDKSSLFYAYSNRVQRIFGDDANDALPGPPLRDFEGDFHFIEGSYKLGETPLGTSQVTAYAFLIDVDNNPNVGESNTFGAHLTAGPLYLEAAYQDGATALNGMGDYDAWYAHAKVAKKFGGATYGAGIEYLEDYFKTPFATVHAFNGFADAFILQRIGLNDAGGAYDGIADIYASYVRAGLPLDITCKLFGHLFLDDGFGDTYGYEGDLVLEKKVTDELTVLAKGCWFVAEDGNGYSDIKQVTVGANFKY